MMASFIIWLSRQDVRGASIQNKIQFGKTPHGVRTYALKQSLIMAQHPEDRPAFKHIRVILHATHHLPRPINEGNVEIPGTSATLDIHGSHRPPQIERGHSRLE